MDREKIKNLSKEDKVDFLRGVGSWNTHVSTELHNSGIRMSDGPIGIRKEKVNHGNALGESETSVCYPSGALLACSFDPDAFALLGRTLANDAKAMEINVVLGPAMNVKRSPLGGRGFEYLSEDPYLTYKMASSYVIAMENEGVGACIKHYAVNSSESDRMVVNEVVDERTLREVYLYAFERVIKETKPSMIMASYNKVNGLHATENPYLLTELLRKEWSYNGVVVSDWYAVNDPVTSILSGLDLEMPCDKYVTKNAELKEINENSTFENKAEEAIGRIIELEEKHPLQKATICFDSDHSIAKKLADESIVLLKNNTNILPLKKKDRLFIIGSLASKPRYQGGGSSHIESYKVTSFLSLLDGIDYKYIDGYDYDDPKKKNKIKKSISDIKASDKVIMFLGTNEKEESEGFDRADLSLPKNQVELVDEIIKLNKNVIVVLMNGGPLVLPFEKDVQGIIETYLGGEAISESLFDVLYGNVNPSGHLTETFPLSVDDVPCSKYFPGDRYNCLYKEGIFVGYRYYETVKKPVLYPFGYGLSYSKFEYSEFKYNDEDNSVTLKVKNVSDVKGKAVPQIYLSKPKDFVFEPDMELCGFLKIELAPNEEKKITIKLNDDIFYYFNIKTHDFERLYGSYKLHLAINAEEVLDTIIYESKGVNENYPYLNTDLESYKSGEITNVSDSEFKSLFNGEIPLIDKNSPFTIDTSLIQAKERGSKGSSILLALLTSVKAVRENKMVLASIIEVPARMLMYMAPELYKNQNRYLDLLNDKHIIKNLIYVIRQLMKMKSMLG